MRFNASLDKLSKLVTAIIAITSLVLIVVGVIKMQEDAQLLIFPISLLSVTLFITFLYAPLGYEINPQNISIIRRVNSFVIPRSEILSIEPLSDDEMGRAWRLFGNGGMFGYTGWFSSSKQGRMRWFVSQRKNYIAITLQNHKKYIVSPDDVDGFMQAMQY
ncbi:MAG: hypothetical protein IPL09_05730 [Bacteroidetes bacterium]|jgi:hypothetical protein|nr:hypothetical protein [Bacteroidota bacterium]MBK7040949.1 hypothetical protein [Bacteroidota bacterium]MBK8328968.1 hypothetical protein [Bacteroidota bacterium]MBK9480436.1 hypothetical protein [Bacteroidota bacterium]HMT34671.1 PH domain-containing protein [Chitinophagaceae bacterium]